MGGYNYAADGLMNEVSRALEQTARNANEAREQRERQALEDANAGNLAEKHALRAALARLQPNHPLLVNKSLQERVKKAGITAMHLTENWDAASEAGRTFNVS